MNQLIRSNGKTIERILRDSEGRLIRATFFVYEVNGRIKARLIETSFIEECLAIENKTFLLPYTLSTCQDYSEDISYPLVTSPYFNTNLLYSCGLQPRAPTL